MAKAWLLTIVVSFAFLARSQAAEISATVPKASAESFDPFEEDLSARFIDEDNGFDEEEAEVECPDGQYFHIRGSRCVELICYGGNRFRDMTTGECLIKKPFGSFSSFGGGEKTLSRNIPRGQAKIAKGRFRYGLPAKLKG